MARFRNYYKVYDARTKKLIAEGNAEECAKQLGKTVQGFRTSVLRINHGVYHNYIIETSKIDE